MHAVVRTGGKQYRVEEGRAITVDRLPGEPGDTVELGEVLLMGEGDAVTVGAPLVEGARVLGTIAEQGRSKKVVVFRYKAKTRSRKKTGHRQAFTRIVVEDILAAGQEPKPKAAPKAAAEAPAAEPEAEAPAGASKKRGRRKAAEPEAAAAAPAEAAAEETVAEAPPEPEPATDEAPAQEKPKRSRRKKTEE